VGSCYKPAQQKRRQERAVKSANEQLQKLRLDLQDSTKHSATGQHLVSLRSCPFVTQWLEAGVWPEICFRHIKC